MVVKDEGVQDTDGTVYALEDGRRDGEQEGSQEAMAGFGQVSLMKLKNRSFYFYFLPPVIYQLLLVEGQW